MEAPEVSNGVKLRRALGWCDLDAGGLVLDGARAQGLRRWRRQHQFLVGLDVAVGRLGIVALVPVNEGSHGLGVPGLTITSADVLTPTTPATRSSQITTTIAVGGGRLDHDAVVSA